MSSIKGPCARRRSMVASDSNALRVYNQYCDEHRDEARGPWSELLVNSPSPVFVPSKPPPSTLPTFTVLHWKDSADTALNPGIRAQNWLKPPSISEPPVPQMPV